jgi:hypothetical protein
MRKEIRHYIKFDDGDEGWYNLQDEFKNGKLKWTSAPASTGRSAPANVQKRSYSPCVDEDDAEDDANQKLPSATTTTTADASKKIKTEEEGTTNIKSESNDGADENEDDEGEESETGTEINSIWPYSQQIPNPLPGSIDKIIKLMDTLEPGQDYYERQQDNRGGCSGTRGKLRKFAKKEENENHPATRHYLATNNWQPPDVETLLALFDLLKTKIIKKK